MEHTHSSLDLNFHKSSKGRGNSLGAVYICTCYFSMIYSIEKLRIFMESSCTKDSNYVYSSSVGPMVQKFKIQFREVMTCTVFFKIHLFVICFLPIEHGTNIACRSCSMDISGLVHPLCAPLCAIALPY